MPIRLCLFHLSQSLFRQIKTKHLVRAYRGNEEFKKIIRSLAALSFLQPNQVLPAYNLLRQKAAELDLGDLADNPDIMGLFNYFRK